MKKQLGKQFNYQPIMNTIDMHEDETTIEIIHFKKGQKEKKKIAEGEIIVVTEGYLELSTSYSLLKTITKGSLIFFAPNVHYNITFLKNTTFIILRLKDHISFCKQFTLDEISNVKHAEEEEYTIMSMKKGFEIYMDTLLAYLGDGIKSNYLFDIKIREFFILLNEYYSKSELAIFFKPLLSCNAQFVYFVLKNYEGIKTVKDFADKANLSLSCFEKEFRKVFNISPYRWMKQKRMKYLYHLILYTSKPFKVISEECGFASPSQMSDFCKKEWGIPPGKIRNNTKKGVETINQE